jgi:hypothetical protein
MSLSRPADGESDFVCEGTQKGRYTKYDSDIKKCLGSKHSLRGYFNFLNVGSFDAATRVCQGKHKFHSCSARLCIRLTT